MARARWWLAGAIWLGVVGWLTLRSAPSQAATVAKLRWYCVACGSEGLADVLHNVLLFMPLGVVARGLGWPWRRTTLLLLGISVAIETTQGTLLTGRDASLGDVLSNVSGGGCGWLALPWVAQLWRPTERDAKRLTVSVLALAIVAWIVSGVGLHPALDGSGVWQAELLRTSPFTERFAGTLDRLAVNGVPISDGAFRPHLASSDSLGVTMQVT
ncbi:MAG: VanZ family protein, partial [Gemmatimonadales bacterium]